jgi:hypothetical protein
LSPAKATRPGFRQSLAASFTDTNKTEYPAINLFHPIYHSYTYPIGSRIDVDRLWPIHLEEEDTEDLIDTFSEPPQFVERLSPVSVQVGDEIIKGKNWTELMVRVYRHSFQLFQGIGRFIESAMKRGEDGGGKVPFVSLAIDPDTYHRIVELDYESGEGTYGHLMNQFAEGTVAPCMTTPFHALLPLLSEAELRLCARISFCFYHRVFKKYQEFLRKQGEEGLAVVPFWIPESAFHSRIEAVLREEFQAFCKKNRMGRPHLVFLLDSSQACQEANDVLMKSWNYIDSNGNGNGTNGRNGSRKSRTNGSYHPAVDHSSVVFCDRTFSEWAVYANPSVKKLLDRTIAKVDSNLNRQEVHYGWAHFEELESLAFSSKSVVNFKQKLIKLTELGYVPLSPDFYVRGKLRGQLGFAELEPHGVQIQENSASADWGVSPPGHFSRWRGVKSADDNGRVCPADPRKFLRETPEGVVEEPGQQFWKLAWEQVRSTVSRAVVGDLDTCEGGLAGLLADMTGSNKPEVRRRNVLDFLGQYTFVYWREHFIQHDLSEADINVQDMANDYLRAGAKGKLNEQQAAVCGAAAQAIFFALESCRSCGTRYEHMDHRAFYQNVVMLTLSACNAVYVYTWLKDTKRARKIVDLIRTELIDFEGAYERHKLKSLGVSREEWKDTLRSHVEDSSDNIVKRAASRIAATHLRPLGFTRDFSRDDELTSVSVGHLWTTEISNPNLKYENRFFCGVMEA